jgi:hypothetical protein
LVSRGWVPSEWVETPDVRQSVASSDEASASQKVSGWKLWNTKQAPLDSEVHIQAYDAEVHIYSMTVFLVSGKSSFNRVV